MTKLSFTCDLNAIITLLLGLFLIFEHLPHMAALKNIALYLALAITFYRLYKDTQIKRRFSINLKQNIAIISLLLLFVIYSLIISTVPYLAGVGSFKDAFSELGRGVSFMIIVLAYATNIAPKTTQSGHFYLSLLLAFIAVSAYYCTPLFTQLKDAWGGGEVESGRIISRAYADYVDRFLPFALFGVMIFTKTWQKILIFLLILLSLSMDILSGTRGSWLAVGISGALAFFMLLFAGFASALKKQARLIAGFALILALGLGFIGINSSIFNFKYAQGADSSGRGLIISQRAPLFLSGDRALLGLGYGKEQYDEFLRRELDKGAKIDMMQVRADGTRYWFNDEPFWLGKFYYYGVVGTGALFGAYVLLLFCAFREFLRKKQDKQRLLYAAIFVSLISYFGVRGLFESINLRELYLFYMAGFFIILKANLSQNELNLTQKSS
ncbi:hypothetical protein [Campylobacter sp. 19-13652]|uniref:hypothetical protein n=1 Tax=Campylobacter sp. 19-13652 TaxID=2840180 RepID=UPI001C774926|nr:hypothetical protein [Campylobacter sp. 19-13652]BCX80030.1 hypothetical protein LBC_14920 [Campylobacter sp. 19-13652]